ncbi:MAG: Rpn family recombination-promoting nuclease/putative transposase [Leptolyngbyaceae cyanobacterium SL_5_9]|nr:Rpn family recombination-promoting nuclease/putative transposase [Leptolyngbyaceae cyanobacterium SL_5_9]
MFDNVSKFLIEQYSTDFASWLIGEPIALTELSPSELSLEPIRADALILLQSTEVILHCEFQTDPDATMPFRMADYALRVFRRFPQKRLVQVVIYLRPTDSDLVQQTVFTANRLRHEFEVVRLWEQPTEIFLQRPGLLPYAALSQASDRTSVLRSVATTIESLTDRQQQSNLGAASAILAGLVLDKQMIRRVLRRDLMQESVIYQELREEARQEARQELREEIRQEARQELREEIRQEARQELREEIRQEARQELREEARQELLERERSLILRLLTCKVGEIPMTTKSQIEALDLTQLEELGEALLNFETLADLSGWLEQLPQ